jgi:hypothetical protein
LDGVISNSLSGALGFLGMELCSANKLLNLHETPDSFNHLSNDGCLDCSMAVPSIDVEIIATLVLLIGATPT